MCTGIGNGSAGGRPGPNRPSTSSAQTLPKLTVADQVLDVDAAVAQGAAVLVRLGDLGAEGDVALQPDLNPGGGGGTSTG